MTAKMMPGGPVADAVFADLDAAHREAASPNGHTPGLGTILVGDDGGERALRRHEAGEGARSSAGRRRTSTCPRTRPRPTSLAAVRAFNDDPARRRASSCSTPRRRRSTTTPRCSTIDPDKDVDGMHPVNLGRLALSMPGPGAVHARGHRGAARALRDPGRGPRGRASSAAASRSAGRSRCCSRRSGRPPTPRSPSCTPACPTGRDYTQRGRHRRRRRRRARHPPARAHHARRRSSSAAACATRAASCCPTSTRRARRSRARSRRGSAASGPPRSRCCSATPSRRPSATCDAASAEPATA